MSKKSPNYKNKMHLPPYDKFPEIVSETIILREIQDDDIKDTKLFPLSPSKVSARFYDTMLKRLNSPSDLEIIQDKEEEKK